MVTVTVKLVRLGCWEKGGRKEIKLAFRPSYIPFLTGDCWLAISSRRQLPFWALNHQEKDEKGEKKEMGFGDNITRESGKDEDGVRALPVAACSAPIRRPSSPLPSVHISWNLLFFSSLRAERIHTHTHTKKKSHKCTLSERCLGYFGTRCCGYRRENKGSLLHVCCVWLCWAAAGETKQNGTHSALLRLMLIFDFSFSQFKSRVAYKSF